jgi:hypothetical protein
MSRGTIRSARRCVSQTSAWYRKDSPYRLRSAYTSGVPELLSNVISITLVGWPSNMSRSCSCDGTNENCMFCFGSGTIHGSREVPSKVSSLPGPQRRLGKTRSRVSVTNHVRCVICGVPLKRVNRHMQKVHGQQPITKPSVSVSEQPELVQGKTVNAPTQDRAPISPPGLPTPQNLVKCQICRVAVPRERLREHLSEKHNLTLCPICGVPIGKSSRHIREVHGPGAPPRPTRRIPQEKSPAVHQGLPPSALSRDRQITTNKVSEQKVNRSLDASRDFAHNFRESGRYGSHPSYDDFDAGNP